MPSRFLCLEPLAAGQKVKLSKEASHHALRVLRLRAGETVFLFDGEGQEFFGDLIDEGGHASVMLHGKADEDREAPLHITLVQGLAVADKMDWIVQKAVELGVRAVQPIEAERSVLRLSGDRALKRVEHWRQVAVAAAEQCGRSRLCDVAAVEFLPRWLAQDFAGERWILDPDAGVSMKALGAPRGPVAIMIGPEGGWSESELVATQVAGCKRVKLGPRVLRTETAGVAAIAAMMALWGDF